MAQSFNDLSVVNKEEFVAELIIQTGFPDSRVKEAIQPQSQRN